MLLKNALANIMQLGLLFQATGKVYFTSPHSLCILNLHCATFALQKTDPISK
jgi:hypothetical protein